MALQSRGIERNPPKRRFLRLLASGVFGAGATIAGPKLGRGSPPSADHWMHAHALFLADPEQVELDLLTAGARQIRGASFSRNSLFFPASVLAGSQPSDRRIEAILLRFKTSSGAEISGVRVFDGERQVEEREGLNLRATEWIDHRVALSLKPVLSRGGGVSIEIAFAAIEREILFGAVGYQMSGSSGS
jgi:hypothetical protein